MDTSTTIPDTSVLSSANCSDHVTDVSEDEVAETIASRQWCYCEESGGENCGSYCDTSGAALYRLKDGRFCVAVESSDTTGHGCRCSGEATRYDSREDAIRLGLTEEQAAMIGLDDERRALLK